MDTCWEWIRNDGHTEFHSVFSFGNLNNAGIWNRIEISDVLFGK